MEVSLDMSKLTKQIIISIQNQNNLGNIIYNETTNAYKIEGKRSRIRSQTDTQLAIMVTRKN
ncbi:hypothetical protein CHELA20_40417 [Hyphomicrobiales bacterium]|nr:hypothetical protein CHELA20_40417 [Hyphomicrobiales bacterium]